MNAVPEDGKRHGNGGYTRGCRCDECREAHRIYNAGRRQVWAERMANGEAHPTHGAISTYTNFGCRCDRCREAMSAYKVGGAQ